VFHGVESKAIVILACVVTRFDTESGLRVWQTHRHFCDS